MFTREGSRFDRGLVDQHHRDVVLDGIYAVTLVAFQSGAVLDELNGGLAGRAREDLEKFGVNRHGRMITHRIELFRAVSGKLKAV
jgi:hypothetical protein